MDVPAPWHKAPRWLLRNAHQVLSYPEMATLNCLWSYANGDGEVWPSINCLARQLAVHPDTVAKALHNLVRHRFIAPTRVEPGKVTVYSLAPTIELLAKGVVDGVPNGCTPRKSSGGPPVKVQGGPPVKVRPDLELRDRESGIKIPAPAPGSASQPTAPEDLMTPKPEDPQELVLLSIGSTRSGKPDPGNPDPNGKKLQLHPPRSAPDKPKALSPEELARVVGTLEDVRHMQRRTPEKDPTDWRFVQGLAKRHASLGNRLPTVMWDAAMALFNCGGRNKDGEAYRDVHAAYAAFLKRETKRAEDNPEPGRIWIDYDAAVARAEAVEREHDRRQAEHAARAAAERASPEGQAILAAARQRWLDEKAHPPPDPYNGFLVGNLRRMQEEQERLRRGRPQPTTTVPQPPVVPWWEQDPPPLGVTPEMVVAKRAELASGKGAVDECLIEERSAG